MSRNLCERNEREEEEEWKWKRGNQVAVIKDGLLVLPLHSVPP